MDSENASSTNETVIQGTRGITAWYCTVVIGEQWQTGMLWQGGTVF